MKQLRLNTFSWQHRLPVFIALIYISFSITLSAQPYEGTCYIASDIIISKTDPSVFDTLLHQGTGDRYAYDRRVDNFINISAHIFQVNWKDEGDFEIIVDTEINDLDSAILYAKQYGKILGQLPYCLRKGINCLVIQGGDALFGGWGGKISTHTEKGQQLEQMGALEEVLVHEATHAVMDSVYEYDKKWLAAQQKDTLFISNYAKENPNREDIAESFLMWLAVRYRSNRISLADSLTIVETIPNRLDFFDRLNCNVHPLDIPVEYIKHQVKEQDLPLDPFMDELENSMTLGELLNSFLLLIPILILVFIGILVIKRLLINSR